MYKLLSRKLLGKNYSSAVKGIIIAAIVGGSLSNVFENKITVAQSVIILTALVSNAIMMWKLLSSSDNAKCLKGLFAMPYDEKKTLWGYAAATGLYTLTMRTSYLIALFIALSKFTAEGAVLFLLSFIYSVFGTLTAFANRAKKPYIGALIAAAGVIMAFILPKGMTAAAVLAAADIAVMVIFNMQKTRAFMVTPGSFQKKSEHHSKPNALLPKYIFRHLLSNKGNLISIVVILFFSCFMSVNFEKMGFKAGCAIGMMIISMNTPLATIVSSNKDLKKKLDTLPNKTKRFFVPYGSVLFGYYIVTYAIFITAFSLATGDLNIKTILAGILFAAESAVIISLLEDKLTITKWNTEADLIRHPRKYILPLIVLTEGLLIFML